MDLVNNLEQNKNQLLDKNNKVNKSLDSTNCSLLHIQNSSTQQNLCKNNFIYYSVAPVTSVNDTCLTTKATLKVNDNIKCLLRYRTQSAHSFVRQNLSSKRKLSQDVNYIHYDPKKEVQEQCKKYSYWLQVFIFLLQ